MTSTSSSSKFIAAFKKLLKRRWAGAAIIFALSNISAVVASVFMLSYYLGNNSTLLSDASSRAINDVVKEPLDLSVEYSAFCGALCIFIGIYCLFQCPKYFGEIYKKRSCDYYFAAPITRGEYFNSAFLFGAIVVSLSYVSGALLNLAILKSIVKAGIIVDFNSCISMLLALLAAFALLLLCAVLSGKKLHYFVLAFIALAIAPLALTGISSNVNNLWGVIRPSDAMAAFSPAGNAICAYLNDIEYFGNYGSAKLLIIISAVEIIAFYITGLIVFKRRKAEVAEVSLSGKIVPFLFLAVVQVYAFMRLGRLNFYAFIIGGGIIVAVITTMVFTAIFYKKVFTKGTLITLACTSAACIIFLSALYLPKHNSFVKYVPEADEIESVEFTEDDWAYSDYNTSIFNRLVASYAYDYATTYSITSSEAIEKTIALHEAVVSDDVISRRYLDYTNPLDSDNEDENDYYYSDTGFEIKYHLKDGSTVARQYCVNARFIIDELRALMRTQELIRQTSPYNADLSKLAFAGVQAFDLTPQIDEDGDVYYENYFYTTEATEITADYAELLECIIADRADESINFSSSDSLIQYYQDSNYNSLAQHNVATIGIYLYSDDASQKYNDKIAAMSWEEFARYRESDWYYEGDFVSDEMEEYYIDVFDEDTRTIEYLKSIGIEVKTAE